MLAEQTALLDDESSVFQTPEAFAYMTLSSVAKGCAKISFSIYPFPLSFLPATHGVIVRSIISNGGFSTSVSSTTLGVVVREAILQLAKKLKITYKKVVS